MNASGARISLRELPAYARDRIDAATSYARDRLALDRFALPLLDLDLRHADPAFADLCRSRLVERSDGSAARCCARVHVFDATMEGWDAPALWRTESGFASRSFDRALAEVGLRGYYHHDAPSWQFFDPAAGLGVHALPEPMAIPPWERGSPLRLFLHWAYASAGNRLTHAATLGLGQRGVLLVGASGSGKSGTTLAGLLNGLTSAGDDYVVVDEAPEVAAHAVFRIFKQDENGLRRVGLTPAAVGAGPLNWRRKYEFDARALAPKAFVDRLVIDAVVIPEIARLTRTQIEPVPASAAALAIAPSAVFHLPGDTDAGFRVFARLARRLPAYRIRLSEDPVEITDAIGAFLEGLSRDARQRHHTGVQRGPFHQSVSRVPAAGAQ